MGTAGTTLHFIFTVVVEPVDKSWWLHALIGSLGGLVWVVLCILIICLCRRRCALRKAKKQNPLTGSYQGLITLTYVMYQSTKYCFDEY